MSTYRQRLPQLRDELFLTDGGLETTLIFHEGVALPSFAAFDLLKDETGTAVLRRYFERMEGEGVHRLGGERKIGVEGQCALAQHAFGAPVRDVAELAGPLRRDGAEMSAQADLLVAAHHVTSEQEQVVLVEGAPQRRDLIRRDLPVQIDTPDLRAERVAERDDIHVRRRSARERGATRSGSRRSRAG